MIKDFIFKTAVRLVFPELLKEMELEGTFELDPDNPLSSLEDADFIRIEDNGADVTLFAFSGIDVLYAGHSRYHLMAVVKRLGRKFGGANFVFLRDCRRLGFMLRPDGKPGGWDFYAEVVAKAAKDLGASHNVTIGSSYGGSIAHHMAYRCGLQQVITFSAMFNANSYLGMRNILRALFNLKQLVREPQGYFEILLVTLSTSWCFRMLKKTVGLEEAPDLVADYAALETKPAVTLYYGEASPPDAAQAQLMACFPEVRRIPVPTGRHNVAGYLYGKGTLGSAITDEISAALGRKAGGAE
jgi:hypothetical protein